jgi:predicted nuclease of predicted toxin-antitoxin system
MKFLLDESLPQKLRNDFGNLHEIWTVKDKGWLGKKNGELLRLLSENNFDFFITIDRNLPYQQNTERLPFTIFVLCAPNNRYETLKNLIPSIFDIIKEGNFKNIIEII